MENQVKLPSARRAGIFLHSAGVTLASGAEVGEMNGSVMEWKVV